MTSMTGTVANGHTGSMTSREPDPEVVPRARRRTFTAKYKLAILAEYDQLDDGDKGALLRREDLYSSLISEWRKARDRGALAGLSAARGRPAADPRDRKIVRLEADKARLEADLARTRRVVEVQGKLSALLEELSEGATDEHEPKP
jgi:transposase-like protein